MKCPRVVTERYRDDAGETKTRTYVRGRPLGKGGFAVVYSMQDPSTGESFAAKVVAKSTLEKERARQKILTEIRIHRGVSNPHVVRFVRCFEDAANVYILMELCSNKTLADVVKQRGGLSEREVACYAREIVAAVAHLHANRVIHRDLKLGNLFLTPAGLDEAGAGPGSDPDLEEPAAGGRLKIGDFGLACRLERDDERKTTICGTPNYIAPEVLAGSKGGGHSYEVDVWSIGVILYTLFVGTPPFQTSDVHATYKRIRANAYAFPETPRVSERAEALIRSCLAPKPADRPKIWDVAAHELLRVGREDWDYPKRPDGGTSAPETKAARAPETKAARDPARASGSSAPSHALALASAPNGDADAADRRRRAEKAAALLADAERAAAAAATTTPTPPARGSASATPGSANRSRPVRDASLGRTTGARAPLSPLPANRATNANANANAGGKSSSASRLAVSRDPPPAAPATFTVLDGVFADAPKPRRAAEEGASRPVPAVNSAPRSDPPRAPPASPATGRVASVSSALAKTVAEEAARARAAFYDDAAPRHAPAAFPRPEARSAAALDGEDATVSTSASDGEEERPAAHARADGAGEKSRAAVAGPSAATSAPLAAASAPLAASPPLERDAITAQLDAMEVGRGRETVPTGTGTACSASAAASAAASSTAPSTPPTLESFPPLWVTRWVDYTSKYGLGYVLSDGTYGVVFNDATKMAQSPGGDDSRPGESPGGDRLEYRERARRGSDASARPPPVAFSARAAPPEGLEKKTKLMRHFRGYLAKDGRSAVERSGGGLGASPGDGASDGASDCASSRARAETESARAEANAMAMATRIGAGGSGTRTVVEESATPAYLPHVKNWLRTKHAVLFRLSNRTIQVNFHDGSEVLLSSEAAATVFTSKSGARGVHALADLPADPELLRRLRYVKEVLHQLVHRA